MMRSFLYFVLYLFQLVHVGSEFVTVKSDHSSRFIISIEEKEWFRTEEVYIWSSGRKLSNENGELKQIGDSKYQGKDSLGQYHEIVNHWQSSDGTLLDTKVKLYSANIENSEQMIVFSQSFPNGIAQV